jgi:hypothetical protein
VNGFVHMAATGRMAAGDIGDRHAAVVEKPAGAQHGIDLADDAQGCPRPGPGASAQWPAMTANRTITVYGASGHTGRFVVSELLRRGWVPLLSGRDPRTLLNAAATVPDDLEVRPAPVDSRAALDRALDGSAAVINCAGPFRWTAGPLIEAALRAGIPYLGVAAEVEAVADAFAHHHAPARHAGTVVIPTMAFYGALGDLLATAAAPEWTAADHVTIAYGLSSWRPTAGTRAAGATSRERRGGRRLAYRDGRLELRTDDAPTADWRFPAPLGTQEVVSDFTTADAVTIPRHIATPALASYMTVTAARDLGDPDPSPPVAVDESGRSSQTFLVDVVVRAGATERRAHAAGRDIYAISAPLVVEATERVLGGRVRGTGALTAGEAFDAEDLLRSLPLDHLSVNQEAQQA